VNVDATIPATLVIGEVERRIGRITLNRPEKRNALTTSMRRALDQHLAAMAADDDVVVVMLTGSGGSFCAGVDLKEAEGSDGHFLSTPPTPVAQALGAFSKPLIAVIDGPAFGGGLELAMACDIRIASTRATFALPEVRIGSIPGSGGTQRLPRLVPPAVAARMLLSGNSIDAAEALRTGLVSDITDERDLAEYAMALAVRIAANAPLSLKAVKKCMSEAYETSLSNGLEVERSLWALLSTTEDRKEGRAAFQEHRPPRFIGK
jgi:E-phenylitaconyl-CoA hydratase